jgi:hypothetical protein
LSVQNAIPVKQKARWITVRRWMLAEGQRHQGILDFFPKMR